MADLLTLLQRSLDSLESPADHAGLTPEVPRPETPPPETSAHSADGAADSVARRLPVDAETVFAVTDLETTGIRANDRIVEIAVARIDGAGRILEEFCSLVNPDRDLGPIHIHGISARDLAPAPTFEEIAGDVLALLEGAVMVGHNVRFDRHFIGQEMERLGIELPDFPYACTMELVSEWHPEIASRRLLDVCRLLGVQPPREHTARHDARATREIFQLCLERFAGSLPIPDPAPLTWEPKPWPARPRSRRTHTRKEAVQIRESEPSFLNRLIAKLPPVKIPEPTLQAYLALLDRALEDRRVCAEEVEALYTFALDLGMSREQAELAHKVYLRDLIGVALADEVLTPAEKRDLEEVRSLLAIDRSGYEELYRQASVAVGKGSPATPATESGDVAGKDLSGKTVCFSGSFLCRVEGERASREVAERIAAERGLVVRRGVTPALDFLVLADPDSMSAKAKEARRYGVRILAEPVFWRWMGVSYE